VIGSVELERLSREGERDARVRQHWLRLQSVEGRSLPEFGFFAYAHESGLGLGDLVPMTIVRSASV
jgi:hypothetical protein